MKYDCIVIGGGIIGTAVLDRLARRKMKVLLLEKQDDVASFSTRANSGIVQRRLRLRSRYAQGSV